MTIILVNVAAYNYENNQQDALHRLIYCSRSALPVPGDVFAHHQEHLTVFTVSGSVHPSCCRLAATWVYTTRYCKSSAPDDGQKHRPKHVEPTWNNKLIYVVHLVGYFYKIYIANRQPNNLIFRNHVRLYQCKEHDSSLTL
jgi:hypothetical protein